MGKFLQSMRPPCAGWFFLTAVGLMLTVFTSAPGAFASETPAKSEQGLRESPKVSIRVRNASLEQVLMMLKQKTNYYVLYNSQAVSKVTGLNMDLEDVGVEAVLRTALQGSGFEYTINNDTIVIKAREASAPPQAAVVQKPVLTGRVIDRNTRQPIAGVSVYFKGNRHGAISDSKGEYRLQVETGQGAASTVVFSFVGMEPQEVGYKGQKEQNMALAEQTQDVQNVVVTGYAPIRKESFTGNSVSISKKELLQASKTNVMKAIQNFDPSFSIVENNSWGSDPNALPEVYIRGESGLGTKQLDQDVTSKANLKDNPNLPIFILDGFQITAQQLYDMDPNRIENVTILKDAAASALYGSRAANGVVVITSVAPTPGKMTVTYNMTGSVVAPDLSDYNLMTAAEKLELERIAGCFIPEDPRDEIVRMQEYNAKLSNIRRGVETDWLSQPLRTAFNHTHSLYVEGGSETLRFGVDFQYANQDGVMKGSKRNRIGAGFYLQYNYKNLSIRNKVSFLQADSEESPYGSFSKFTTAQPYDEFMDENGNYLPELKNWGSSYEKENPLYEAGLHNFDKTRTQDFTDNFSINWNITPYLLLKGQMSITKTIDQWDKFLDPLSLRNNPLLGLGNLVSGRLDTRRSDNMRYDMSAFAAFNRSFSDHNINLQAGINMLDATDKSLSSRYLGFPSGALSSVNYAQMMDGKPISTEGTERTVGFFAGLNYSYRFIYLFDATFRMDGNSAFGRDKRFAPFWSVGAGLNIHNYDFMKKSETVSTFRVRASYGEIGKINFPPYAARTSYTILADEWYKTGFGAVLKALGNPNLKWETTKTLDAGFELGLWQDRIFTKFSFYNKLTVDLINDVTIPSSTGFTTYRDNVGEIRNRGVELDIRAMVLRRKELSLTLNFRLAHNQNRIMKISESLKEYNRLVQEKLDSGNPRVDDEVSRPYMQYVEGISSNSIWGMQSLGINPATGEEVFITPDGRITDIWTASQQQVLGVRDPKARGSFGFNLVWKQFSLYTSFLYEAGGQRYNQTLVDKVETVSIYQSNVDRRVMNDRWSTPGQVALYKKMEPGRGGVSKTQPTSRFVQDYNMLQFTTMNIGYEFKRSTIAPLRLSMLRLEIGANDLFHVSSVKQERGLSYPFARTFTFSIQASF